MSEYCKEQRALCTRGRCKISDLQCVNCAGIQALAVLLWQCWLWLSEQAPQSLPLLMRRWSGHFPIGSPPGSLRCSSGFRLATGTTSQISTIGGGSSATGHLIPSTSIVRSTLPLKGNNGTVEEVSGAEGQRWVLSELWRSKFWEV